MNNSSGKEVLENEIQDLVQNYSLTTEIVELLRKNTRNRRNTAACRRQKRAQWALF